MICQRSEQWKSALASGKHYDNFPKDLLKNMKWYEYLHSIFGYLQEK